MTTPHDRAVTAVSNVLELTVYHLNELAAKASESSTQVLARTAAEVVARYLNSIA